MGNSLILASLATDAVSNLGFRDVKELTSQQGGSIDSAMLTDGDGNHYAVRMGSTDAASLELATEVAALKLVGSLGLPFKVSKVVGETRARGFRPAIVFDFVYGKPIDLGRLDATGTLVESIGATIAKIHGISSELVQEAGFPEFSAQETIRLRLNQLDRLAGTGKIPKVLLDRWSEALENVNLFRFTPTAVHSNLNSVNVLELDGQVSGVLGWHGLKVGDPAEDFAWLAAPGVNELMDAARFAYLSARETTDPNLGARAHLYDELTRGSWLLHGITIGDESIVADGVAMLGGLAAEVEEGIAPVLIAGSFASSGGGFLETADDVEPELVVEQDTHMTFVDDKTREIELPEKTDDELF